MAALVFYEENDPACYTAALYDETELRWQETVKKDSLVRWLAEAYKSKRLKRQDSLICVLPETLLVRALLALPPQLRSAQKRGMAASHLTPRLQERPAALTLFAVAGTGLTACAGISSQDLAQVQQRFGRYAPRLAFAGAGDLWLAGAAALADGYYLLQAPLWTAVAAVAGGRLIDARAANGVSGLALHQSLLEAHQALGWQPADGTLRPLPLPAAPALDLARLQMASFRAGRVVGGWQGDKGLAALLLACVVVPGLLLLALSLRPVEEPVPAEPVAQNDVQRSEYSSLLTEAYRVKSERITLSGQEAGEGVLALNGRCDEALDLADYMRQLAAVEPALDPLLLEMTRETEEEDGYHYEFVIQIGQEGGAAS